MKSLKLITLCIITLFITTAYSQKQEVVYMKIQQNYDILHIGSYIRISYPNGEIKVIELDKAGLRTNNENEIENTQLIQEAINSLTKEGYELISSSITGNRELTLTLMTFSREIKIE